MNKFFALIAFVLLSTITMAQKVGYVNPEAVISIMPSAKTAQANFESYVKTVATPAITSKAKAYETKVNDFKANAANMSDARKEVVYKEIVKLEQELTQLHSQNQTEQKIAQKEAELFEPVQKKAGELIKNVAKANGFTVVMDARGGIVYAEESADLFPLIKKQLGVN